MHSLTFRQWVAIASSWALIIASLPRTAIAARDDPPPPPLPSIIITALPDSESSIQLSANTLQGLLGNDVSVIALYEVTDEVADEFLNNIDPECLLGQTENPVDADGKPLPPPVRLPPGTQGQPNEWKPVRGTPDRPIKWVPKYPIPTEEGGQPSSSWDPEGDHWDVDNGDGTRTRVKPDGTIVDHDGVVLPQQQLPNPFEGIDWDIVTDFVAIGSVSVVVVLGIVVFIIKWLVSGAAQAQADSHHPVLDVAMDEPVNPAYDQDELGLTVPVDFCRVGPHESEPTVAVSHSSRLSALVG